MKKVTLFVGMIAMAAFLSTSVSAQDKTKETKPATTQTAPAKTDAKAPASKEASKEGCKPGCTMHKDKCCDKDKKATTAPATPEKK
ncbi:MAG: hypothetical protein NTU51_05180 [Bacteroidetes bacterium]|nr:hypothetical protein [Bacteroidota bacterium]